MSDFLDFAEDLNAGNMLIGFLMVLASLLTVLASFSPGLGLEFSVLGSVLILVYGFLLLVGGFLQGEALYMRYFMDISSLAGVLLAFSFLFGIISYGLWLKMAVALLLFVGAPATALTWLTREDTYEQHRQDESDYLRRD